MLVVVAYDVNTETKEGRKRLRHVAKICTNVGILSLSVMLMRQNARYSSIGWNRRLIQKGTACGFITWEIVISRRWNISVQRKP